MTAARRPDRAEHTAAPVATLVRSLGAVDGALITIGATLGGGIFLTTGDIARRLSPARDDPPPLGRGRALRARRRPRLLRARGDVPRAGGQYHFLKEAYGRLWGFLFGWTSFLVIMTGGVAAIAVGFGEYLGAFVPSSARHVELLSVTLVDWPVDRPVPSSPARWPSSRSPA